MYIVLVLMQKEFTILSVAFSRIHLLVLTCLSSLHALLCICSHICVYAPLSLVWFIARLTARWPGYRPVNLWSNPNHPSSRCERHKREGYLPVMSFKDCGRLPATERSRLSAWERTGWISPVRQHVSPFRTTFPHLAL